MCGIVGYIGPQEATPILLDGLKRLEYRGYDSAGVAIFNGDLQIERCKGKLVNLIHRLEAHRLAGSTGLGHTRWATHGSPSEMNAHPQSSDHTVVIHNGIIENYLELKEELVAAGVKFTSQTDTEIIPNLIDYHWNQTKDVEKAFRIAVSRLKGSFAIGMFSKRDPHSIYAAKYRNPLILGIGKGENFLASDIPAVLNYTREIIILEDGDFARISAQGVGITDVEGKIRPRQSRQITWTSAMAEKEDYSHFMLKEIHEQPKAVAQTIQGRVNQAQGCLTLDELNIDKSFINNISRVVIVACGTSWHAGLAGKYLFESLAKVPVEVDLASEFRYRTPILDKNCLFIAISQSGETADTLAAIDEAKQLGAKVLSICNVLDSTIPRASHYTFYTHAGPEIGVASTKAFTTQLVSLYMLALHFAEQRDVMSRQQLKPYLADLLALPRLMEDCLADEPTVQELAKKFFQYADFLYLGRSMAYPIALEGALKLKEISYIHAEGYPAGEIKHGPIALIDEKMPVLVIASNDSNYEKTLSNLSEVKTRGGITILMINKELHAKLGKVPGVDYLVLTPNSNASLLPVLQTIPLQLLAYHIAVLRGTDVDQPRNLAKSVTVE
jgi:glucosamine--fructose-6-phosphate aminotransferase (isomerizing)